MGGTDTSALFMYIIYICCSYAQQCIFYTPTLQEQRTKTLTAYYILLNKFRNVSHVSMCLMFIYIQIHYVVIHICINVPILYVSTSTSYTIQIDSDKR